MWASCIRSAVRKKLTDKTYFNTLYPYHLSNIEVKNELTYTPAPTIRFHGSTGKSSFYFNFYFTLLYFSLYF